MVEEVQEAPVHLAGRGHVQELRNEVLVVEATEPERVAEDDIVAENLRVADAQVLVERRPEILRRVVAAGRRHVGDGCTVVAADGAGQRIADDAALGARHEPAVERHQRDAAVAADAVAIDEVAQLELRRVRCPQVSDGVTLTFLDGSCR